MEDESIIARYWDKDEAAIAESHTKYGRVLRGIAFSVLSNREDSEECVNDTYGKAWDSMPPQKPNSLSAFLGRITRNLSLSRWRAVHAQKRDVGLVTELTDCLPAQETVESAISEQELTDVLASWLRALPRQERALFLRRYWYGESMDELAAVCGLTANQIAGRLFRLRARLRKVLESEGIAI